jgi:hypothetical protein
MRTLEQRRDIYNIVKGRIDGGMSGREARRNVEYDGATFEVSNRTWKSYREEFAGQPVVPQPRQPLVGDDLADITHEAPPEQRPQIVTVRVVDESRKLGDAKVKVRFTVGLSPARWRQLQARAEKKETKPAALAAMMIAECLDKE